MLRRRSAGHWLGLLIVLAGAVAIVLRQGGLPSRWSPFPALDLAIRDAWFVDLRLAELKRDTALCRRVMRRPLIESTSLPDHPISNGCGWLNAVRIATAGGARLPLDKASCELAAALTMWIAHVVQPSAERHLGSRVASVQHFGGYSCRNIAGSRWLSGVRSEHATANALDVSGFVLADGRRVSVLTHWPRSGPETRFLHEIHDGACRYFRVAIGPNFNAAHRDHFHLDRGPFSRCK